MLKRLLRYIFSLFKSTKTEKIVELVATGCVPAPTSDCANAILKYKKM